MTNLTTRNIVFGMLMAFVLALGVQGTADALTLDHRSGGGNYRTVFPGDPFTISFSVRLAGNATAKPGHITVSGQTDYSYYTEGDNVQSGYQSGNETYGNPSTTTTTDDVLVSAAAAVYYNDEALAINIPDGFILRKGSARVPAQSATSRLNERATDTATLGAFSLHEAAADRNLRFSTTITLNGTASTTPNTYTITITDVTPESDFPATNPAPTSGTSLTFTIYVVPRVHQLDTRATALASGSGSVYYGYKDAEHQVNTAFAFTPTANAPVYYSVQGSGSLHVGEDNSNPKLPLPNGILTSSSASVYLRGHTATSRVTASVGGTTPHTVIYIYIDPSNVARYPRLEITNGNNQSGASSGQLEDYLEVKVTDGRGSPVSGVAVEFTTTATGSMFIPVPGTMVYGTAAALAAAVSDPVNGMVYAATSTVPPKKASPVFVQTDRSGLAKVYYELGTDTTQMITANLVGVLPSLYVSKSFTASLGGTGSTRVANLEIVSGNPQRAAKAKQLDAPLVVIARSTAGFRIPNVVIQFRTNTGILSRHGLTQKPGEGSGSGQVPTGTLNPDTGQQIYVVTGSNGQASVDYNIGQIVVAREVVAEVRHESRDSDYSFAIDRVVFNINGGGARAPTPASIPTPTSTGSLQIGVTGEGATRSVTVTATSVAGTATAIPVVLTGTALGGGTRSVTSGTAIEITLPTEPDDYTLTATASVAGYTPDTETITVAGPTSLGTISITSIGTPTNGIQTFSITVVDTNNNRISGALTVRVSGTGFTTRNVATANGAGAIGLPLPTAAGLYTLTASAEGYESGTTRIRVAGTAQTTTTDTPTTTPTTTPETRVREPDRVSIVGPSQRTGTTNTELDASLIVQVVDEDGDAVEDTRVIFRVRTGQGRLTQRGNGRAVVVQTDSRGHARATYTPMSASSTIEVEARGVTRRVTFTITASGGAPTETPTPTSTRAPGDAIHPVVHIGAAGRPPMLWVDSGAIYALVGANVQRFIPSVDNALNIAIGGTKVYWTEKTGESSGTINSANLDGTGVKELTEIMAVPMGIVVDTANRKLYWTNSRGRIQSANLDGSIIQNVLENLTSPLDIALSGGNVYWTHSNGGVGFVNLTGQKQIRNISNGADASGSLAIGGGKIYWTEKSGESGGTINSANLDGSGAKQLASILATPSGIAVDPARSKLFWTNSRGRIQSATLEGSSIQNVVDGLGSPGDMVLSNSIKAPAGTTPTPTTPTPQTTRTTPTYDVDGSGTVDNVDLFLVTLAVGTRNTQYDVNGDGTVDDKDIILVRENRDDAAAAAPMIVGVQLTPEQVSRLQAQIDLLVATSDRSPAALKTLIYLQQLLATARPEQTQLLANYPNPFNPETWIPYELATDTDVRITIYNAQGVGIRTLQLGQQSAGYYTDRERAAYWDGRNALGEQVASGIYFYQLETDTLSSLRKMVILK